jgi:hypothetical protein
VTAPPRAVRSRRRWDGTGETWLPDRASGSVPIELALGTGLLLLPIALLVLSFPTWIERQSAARVAAQEAARIAVLADDPRTAVQHAEALVARTADNHAIAASDLTFCFAVHPLGSSTPASCTGLNDPPRGSAVTAYVTVRLPALGLPGLDAVLPEVRWTAQATERVDTYRSR